MATMAMTSPPSPSLGSITCKTQDTHLKIKQ